jgi:putative spermidine/putrescine transport system permease protein
MLYFFLPLIATFEFSLKMIKDRYTFEAYRVAFTDPSSSSISDIRSCGRSSP